MLRMLNLYRIYDILQREYGPQGWWPVTDDEKTQPSYHKGDYTFPRTNQQLFEIMVGAILTQNTSWKNVEKALMQLNHYQLLSADAITKIHLKTLAKHIRSSGYHNQKAKKLKHLVQFLEQYPFPELKKRTASELRELLLNVHGIGPETADSIVLYAFNKPLFVIDAYTKRIFSRIGLCKEDVSYDELQHKIVNELIDEVQIYNEYHALLVEHAKRYCRTKPLCEDCPLKNGCTFSTRGVELNNLAVVH